MGRDYYVDKEAKFREILRDYRSMEYYLPNHSLNLKGSIRITGLESWYDYSLYRGDGCDLKKITKKSFMGIKNKDVINHFQTQVAGVSSKIVFCSASDYLKLKNIEKLNTDFFENKSVNLRVYSDVELSNDQYPKRHDWGYTTVYTSNLELLKSAYEKYSVYNKEKVLLLGKGIRRLFGV